MIDSPREVLWAYERAFEQSVAFSRGGSDPMEALTPWQQYRPVPEAERQHYPALIQHYQQQGAPASSEHILAYLRGMSPDANALCVSITSLCCACRPHQQVHTGYSPTCRSRLVWYTCPAVHDLSSCVQSEVLAQKPEYSQVSV